MAAVLELPVPAEGVDGLHHQTDLGGVGGRPGGVVGQDGEGCPELRVDHPDLDQAALDQCQSEQFDHPGFAAAGAAEDQAAERAPVVAEDPPGQEFPVGVAAGVGGGFPVEQFEGGGHAGVGHVGGGVGSVQDEEPGEVFPAVGVDVDLAFVEAEFQRAGDFRGLGL